jgi:CelD/BcsL family acetyltransferase involved in cellulose biosynthesis
MVCAPERYEIITDHLKLLSLKRYWDDLYARSSEYDLTQSFEWCRCSWQIVAKPQGHRLHCLVGWQGDRVVLIWPFVTPRQVLRPAAYHAHPLGPETSEYSGVLVEPGPEAHRRILIAWNILCRNFDKITLSCVKKGSPLHCVIVANKFTPHSTQVWSTPHVSWDGYQDWESYYRLLKRDFRHSLRRTRRRLIEHGNLSFELVQDRDRFPVVLDWMFRNKTNWLARTNQQSIWRETDIYRNFLVAVAQTKAIEQIKVFTLKVNEEIISALFCRISKLRVENVIAVFDPAYGKYGPGQLLYEDILKWAFERRLDCDFRLGDQSYKQSWANSKSEATTYQFVTSLRGAAFTAAGVAYTAATTWFERLTLQRFVRKARTERRGQVRELSENFASEIADGQGLVAKMR